MRVHKTSIEKLSENYRVAIAIIESKNVLRRVFGCLWTELIDHPGSVNFVKCQRSYGTKISDCRLGRADKLAPLWQIPLEKTTHDVLLLGVSE